MKLKTLGKFFKIWYPTLIMAVIIFVFSASSSVDSKKQSGLIVNVLTTLFPNLKDAEFLVKIVRKSAHFIEYMVLGFLTARSMRLSKVKHSFVSIIACALYATSDEIHQSFVPGRSAEIGDVALDTISASFGVFIYWLFTRKKQ